MRIVLTLFCTLLVSCVGAPNRQAYNYASDDAWSVCADSCPGQECLCILGSGNTWYISPEVGE